MLMCVYLIIFHENEFVFETQIKHKYNYGHIRKRKLPQVLVTPTQGRSFKAFGKIESLIEMFGTTAISTSY